MINDSGPAQTRIVALPYDAAVEEVHIDESLSFLDGHVNAALQLGAAPYLPEAQRMSMGVVRPSAAIAEADQMHQLRFAAYEAPKTTVQTVLPVQAVENVLAVPPGEASPHVAAAPGTHMTGEAAEHISSPAHRFLMLRTSRHMAQGCMF